MSDKKFFDTLKNEGIDGVLKRYIPVTVLLDEARAEIARLTEENTAQRKVMQAMAKDSGNAGTCVEWPEYSLMKETDSDHCIIKHFTSEAEKGRT